MPRPDHVRRLRINSQHPTAPNTQISGAWQSIAAQSSGSPTSPHIPRAEWESDSAQHPAGHMAFPTGSLSLGAALDAGQRSGTAQLFPLLCFYHCLFHELVKSSVQSTGEVSKRQPCS